MEIKANLKVYARNKRWQPGRIEIDLPEGWELDWEWDSAAHHAVPVCHQRDTNGIPDTIVIGIRRSAFDPVEETE